MAITINTEPKNINSAYNPNRWVIDSDNKNEEGFRYLISVVDFNTGITVKKFPALPRPVDGLCEFDISKVAQDQLESMDDFSTLNGYSVDTNLKNEFNYFITVQEEYLSNWSYYDTEFISGSLTKCVGTSTPPFAIGDVVVVIPDDPLIRPGFQGLMNVINVDLVNNYVVFETPWLSTGLNPGVIKFADNRKVTGAPIDSRKRKVIKSAVRFVDWYTGIIGDAYTANDADSKFLTYAPDDLYVTPTTDIYWWIDLAVNKFKVVYETSNDDIYAFNHNISSSPTTLAFLDVLPKSGSAVGDILANSPSYYFFYLADGDDNQITKKYKINVDYRCPLIDDVHLLFEDRLGSWNSFTFNAMNGKDVTVNKAIYNQPIKFKADGNYDKTNAQGITTSSINFTDTFTLRTKSILNREQDIFFEELLTSGNVFMKWNGEYQRVNIVSNSGELKNKKQSGLRRREIVVQPANQDVTNF